MKEKDIDFQKLVSAGPDLYEACKMAQGFVQVLREYEKMGGVFPFSSDKLRQNFARCLDKVETKCKTAVAKAESKVACLN